MAALQQTIRDNVLYAYGYLQGRTFAFPRSISELYGLAVSKVTSFISLPLPLLSFLALPLFGGTSTSVNFLLFYLTWSSLVLTHDPLNVEIYGTLAIRTLLYLLPALGFFAFDLAIPDLAKGIKAYGTKQLPTQVDRNRLVKIAGLASFNVLLAVALQAAIEVLATQYLHLRSILKVTSAVPLPWNIAKDLLKGLALRGVIHYTIHRYALHTYTSPLKTWHLQWQHSVRLPFSLLSAYDHPVCHLLSHWVPSFVPSYLFRFHVLTWHLFTVLISLEELFVYSGYAVLPSSIILAGMARRTDAHFATSYTGAEACNFGHWGILDFVFGTTCKDTASVMDDLQDEADKHRIEQRASKAVEGALRGAKDRDPDSQSDAAQENEQDPDRADGDTEYMPKGDADAQGGADKDDEAANTPPKRRSRRRKAA